MSLRPRLMLSVTIIAVAALALLTGSLFSIRAATAQPVTEVGILQNFPVLAANGYANLPEFSGSADGIVGVSCDGAGPLAGRVVPAIVITRLDPDLTRMRIASWGTGTPVVNGTVYVTCTLEVISGTTAATGMHALQAKLGR